MARGRFLELLNLQDLCEIFHAHFEETPLLPPTNLNGSQNHKKRNCHLLYDLHLPPSLTPNRYKTFTKTTPCARTHSHFRTIEAIYEVSPKFSFTPLLFLESYVLMSHSNVNSYIFILESITTMLNKK